MITQSLLQDVEVESIDSEKQTTIETESEYDSCHAYGHNYYTIVSSQLSSVMLAQNQIHMI